jgi:hypothetical protein
MKTYDQLHTYILDEAEVYKKANDDNEFDIIELDTFRHIIAFAKAEGVVVSGFNLDVIIYGAHAEDNKNTLDYMTDLCCILDNLADKQHLPPATAALLNLWNAKFRAA